MAGDEYIAWLERRGRDPRQKRLISSDALDVEQILGQHAYFAGSLRNGATPDDFRSASDFHDANRWVPIAAFASAPAGARCSPTTSAMQSPSNGGFNPSAWSANSLKSTAAPR